MPIGNELIDAPDFAANSRKPVGLRKQSLVDNYLLRLFGDFVVTGGTGVGSIYPDALHRLIRRYILRGDGQDMQSNSAQANRLLDRFLSPGELPQVLPANLDPDTSQPIDLQLEIPAGMLHSYNPHAFAFPSYAVASPQFLVDFADASAFAEGADGALSLENVTVQLWERPLFGLPKQPASIYGARLTNEVTYPVVQSESSRKLYMETAEPGMEIRAVLVEAFAGGAGGEDFEYDDSLIASVKLVVDGADRLDQTDFVVQQARNKKQYQLAELTPGAVLIDAAEDKRTAPGELYTVRTEQAPYIELELDKQPGDCLVRLTPVIAARQSRSG